MFVYADITTREMWTQVPPVPCSMLSWYTSSWADIRITEVWFDGTDERLEITNIGDQPFSWSYSLSWVKSSTIFITSYILPWESLIIWDSLLWLTWVYFVLTGQWLSIPDSTWSTIKLLQQGIITQEITFSKQFIEIIPNWYSLEAIVSWWVLYRQQTPEDHDNELLSTAVANPTIVYCYYNSSWEDDTYSGNATSIDSWYTSSTGIDINETWYSTTTWTQSITWIEYTSWYINSWITYSWSTENIFTWNISTWNISTWNTSTWNLPSSPPCSISEIHAVSTPSLPEYIELYCSGSYSGTYVFSGIWVWSSIKQVHLVATTWTYILITSINTWYVALLEHVILVPWISLRDDGETITYFISWTQYPTQLPITFPPLTTTDSYYPTCHTTWCILSPTPWYSHLLLDIIQPIILTPTPIVSQNSVTTTSSSTYYQDLYTKRKQTAETYKKTITSLEKQVKNLWGKSTTITTWSTLQLSSKSLSEKSSSPRKISSTALKSTKSSQSSSKKSSSKKSSPTTTSSKITKSLISNISSKSLSSKKSTTSNKKSSSKSSEKMISTTSVAYQKLFHEHLLYKNYITFLDKHLKNHLYSTYENIGILKIDKILKTSLKKIQKKEYFFTGSALSGVSVLDINTQRYKSLQKSKIDMVYIKWRQTWSSIFTLFSRVSWKNYMKI